MAKAMTGLYEQDGISPERVSHVVAFAMDQPGDTTVNALRLVQPHSPGNGRSAPDHAPSRKSPIQVLMGAKQWIADIQGQKA